MNAPNELKRPAVQTEAPAANFLEQWTSYWFDAMQRGVLFLDVLRERANNMLEHERKGLPPLLDFDYEVLLDARTFEHPANYALLRILGAHGERMEDCLDSRCSPGSVEVRSRVAGLTARAMSELGTHNGALSQPVSKVPS